jgi:prepilin-type N-terminal cleavage/methylation domain-containing protein
VSANINDESGFTLTELVISIGLIAIISVSLLSAITYYFAYVTRNNIVVDMTTDSQNLLRSTVEELRFGSGIRQTNAITDPNGPGGGWNTGNSNFVIVISVPAMDSSKNYIIDPDTGSPYNNELVYFKQGTDLFRRRLAHPDAAGNTMKTSCPANLATSTCPADTRLIQYLDDMEFTLYDQDDNSTADPLLARSVLVTLSMRRDTFGEPLTLENNIRTTLRNNFQ